MSEAHATGFGYASGGGVYALGGLTSLYSTLSNNVALVEGGTPSFGGGAFARGASLLLGTTVSGNQAWRMGGLALADNTGLSSDIINSTVSGNFADTIGGVFGRGPLNIYNSTIAFNTSHTWTDGSGHYFAAGVYITTSGNLDSSIISNNVNTAAPFDTADSTGGTSAGWNGSNNNVMNLPAAVSDRHLARGSGTASARGQRRPDEDARADAGPVGHLRRHQRAEYAVGSARLRFPASVGGRFPGDRRAADQLRHHLRERLQLTLHATARASRERDVPRRNAYQQSVQLDGAGATRASRSSRYGPRSQPAVNV